MCERRMSWEGLIRETRRYLDETGPTGERKWVVPGN